ncbi:MAG: polysaccharide lyase, partial [Verrucomicrobiota bacterium]
DYAPGRIGPSEGGAAWNQSFEGRDEVVLAYVVRFSADFDWRRCPAACRPGKTTGGRRADGLNGFSVRPMWRADGRMEAYAYHAGQTKDYGDSLSLPKDFRLQRDRDIQISLRVRMNHPERADGLLVLKVTSGDTTAEVTSHKMLWRKTQTIKADKLLFESFYGGSDLSWAPDRACHAEFGNLGIE